MAKNTSSFPLNSNADDVAFSKISNFGVVLYQEQYRGLLELLQQFKQAKHHVASSVTTHLPTVNGMLPKSNPSTKQNQWLLDTGATDYITINLGSFSSYNSIAPILITLPNGV
ncbi:hypothetical protein RJT34_08108 [Clitoria ternatea]|uniref:Uncharacterized protein n=1 Tax=Clitoria ternatea TaxID=43366 RepID=A0AAN9K5X5_CLITE